MKAVEKKPVRKSVITRLKSLKDKFMLACLKVLFKKRRCLLKHCWLLGYSGWLLGSCCAVAGVLLGWLIEFVLGDYRHSHLC